MRRSSSRTPARHARTRSTTSPALPGPRCRARSPSASRSSSAEAWSRLSSSARVRAEPARTSRCDLIPWGRGRPGSGCSCVQRGGACRPAARARAMTWGSAVPALPLGSGAADRARAHLLIDRPAQARAGGWSVGSLLQRWRSRAANGPAPPAIEIRHGHRVLTPDDAGSPAEVSLQPGTHHVGTRPCGMHRRYTAPLEPGRRSTCRFGSTAPEADPTDAGAPVDCK
jgi:hypothetical protein